MLINSFFTIFNLPEQIEEINSEKQVEFAVAIKINPKHSIFEGHFPGQPIVPGVTYIEMIKEIIELVLKKKLLLQEASNIKFLAITNPLQNPKLDFSFKLILKEANLLSAKLLITSENVSVIKFDGKFLIQ